jgi:hypothetical protein
MENNQTNKMADGKTSNGQEVRNGYRSEEEIEYGSDYPLEEIAWE